MTDKRTDETIFELRIRHKQLGDLDDRVIQVLVPNEELEDTRRWATVEPMMKARMEKEGFPLDEYELVHIRNAGRRWVR